MLLVAISASAQTFTILLDFDGANGSYPLGSLVQGSDGNYYGTTNGGGANNYGTVFKLTPSGQLTTIYSFCSQPNCSDGIYPEAGLLLTLDGSFYGTTAYGGDEGCISPYGCGTVFKITPQGKLTTVHTFESTDGAVPWAGLVEYGGNFYGTSSAGGEVPCGPFTRGCGTVFKMTPEGVVTTLHIFDYSDGAYSVASLVQATNGGFYGSTVYGGSLDCGNSDYGCGGLFRVSPSGAFTNVHLFGTTGLPDAPLIQANDGNLYGTTMNGMIFRLAPSGKLTTLFEFGSGVIPVAVVQGTDGDLYGVTAYGGSENLGTLFQLTLGGVLTDLQDFDFSDGSNAQEPLLQATRGSFYGVAANSGESGTNCPSGCGTLFNLSMGLNPFISLTSTLGKPGQQVGILGQGLSGTTSVAFNGTSATFNVVTDTFIRATVPSGTTSGFVAATTPSGELTSNVPFTLIP